MKPFEIFYTENKFQLYKIRQAKATLDSYISCNTAMPFVLQRINRLIYVPVIYPWNALSYVIINIMDKRVLRSIFFDNHREVIFKKNLLNKSTMLKNYDLKKCLIKKKCKLIQRKNYIKIICCYVFQIITVLAL